MWPGTAEKAPPGKRPIRVQCGQPGPNPPDEGECPKLSPRAICEEIAVEACWAGSYKVDQGVIREWGSELELAARQKAS